MSYVRPAHPLRGTEILVVVYRAIPLYLPVYMPTPLSNLIRLNIDLNTGIARFGWVATSYRVRF